MHMNSLCYINGEITSTSEGMIGISDLGLQRGYGVFDFGRTYNGKLFHFEENIERFRRSASSLHLAPPVSDQEILEIAKQLIKGSGLIKPAVRLILTGGYSPTLEEPNFIVISRLFNILCQRSFACPQSFIASSSLPAKKIDN